MRWDVEGEVRRVLGMYDRYEISADYRDKLILEATSRGRKDITSRTRGQSMRFTFTGRALEDLREIAEREGIELDEVIESALGLKKWALDVKDDGGQVIVRRKRDEDKELVL